jgi:heterodisulfide reductase subunit A-like polyferredoxin
MLEEKKRYIIDFTDIPEDRACMPELSAEERVKNFEEIEKGFTREQAQREARRCLSCRRCLGCKLCLAACEKEAIDFDQKDEESELEVDSIIITPGILKNPAPIDECFGYMKYSNVITDTEFERILHSEGPYGGLILRPSDGEIPRKIAFIYSDEKQISQHSLIPLLKGAAVIRNRIEGSEIWLLSNHAIEAKDSYKSYFDQIPDLISKNCKVLSIKELEESGNLMIEFLEEGKKQKGDFHLVIISTQLQLPTPVKIVGEQLGLKLAKNIDSTEDLSLQQTEKEGISVAGGVTLG